MSTQILVVDDSLLERLLIEGLLGKNPEYEVALAEDGRQALAMIDADPPDLVITDLIMPEMNGLELVQNLRQKHPEIPVILMTAYGDETTVIEALEAGAASYVPKSQKAERLMPAIDRLVKKAVTDRCDQQLGKCLSEYHCRFALPNDRKLIRALTSQVQQAMASLGFANTVERIRVGEAFEEAVLNAMYHGNLELNPEELEKVRAELDEHLLDRLIEERCRETHIQGRRILVVVHLTFEEARFVIRDEGRGFDAMKLTRRDSLEGHRGLTLIQSLMDEVKYNQAGNELVLRKHYGSESFVSTSVVDH